MHITFDLETLGNTSNAPIVQIGAVKFTQDGTIHEEFVRHIKLESLERYGFHMDFSTLSWWFNQDDAAIKSVFGTDKERIDIRLALIEFQKWLGSAGDHVYWSHATFDPPILVNNHNKVGLVCAIPFRLYRDIRTLNDLAGIASVIRKGIAHDALDDCRFQAAYISQLLQKLNNGSNT